MLFLIEKNFILFYNKYESRVSVMKKQGIFFLLLLLVFPIFIFAETDKVEFFNKKIENISDTNAPQYDYFYKKDEEGNNISNAKFILRDKEGKIKYDVLYDEDHKAYGYVKSFEYDNQKLLSVLPSNVKDIVSNFKKEEDFLPYIKTFDYQSTISNFENIKVECIEKLDDVVNFTTSVTESKNYSSCQVRVPTVLFLEEVVTPKGYEKETAVLPAIVYFIYDFDQETKEVENIFSGIETYIDGVVFERLYKYDNTLDYDNIESVYNAFINYDDSMQYKKTRCEEVKMSNTIGNNTFYNIKKLASDELELVKLACTPIIVDKKGKSNISINSYVNSKEEINITESSNVEIKVFLKNSGKAPSYENKVVSNVPEGVEYVDGSATDDGVYDSEKKTVTWDLDYLDANSGYMFSYNVSVSTGNKESVYVVTSSVSNEENTESIVSNGARVTTPGMGSNDTEEVVNPKTGDERRFVIILGLLIGSIVLFTIKGKKPLGL